MTLGQTHILPPVELDPRANDPLLEVYPPALTVEERTYSQYGARVHQAVEANFSQTHCNRTKYGALRMEFTIEIQPTQHWQKTPTFAEVADKLCEKFMGAIADLWVANGKSEGELYRLAKAMLADSLADKVEGS